jgi:hypothetical protein
MMMDRNKLLELALEELNRQRAAVDEEIASVVAELNGTGAVIRQSKSIAPSAGRKGGRVKTAAERKAHSLRMKEIWAARRAKAAKPTVKPAKAAKPTDPKATAKQSGAKKNARSLAMKAAWAKRKVAAASK